MSSPLVVTPSTVVACDVPAPTPSRFWDRRAARYAKKPVPDADAYARTLERVRAYLAPTDRVLELGCGTGTTALRLAASAGQILATDYSAKMIAIAAAKAHAEGTTNVCFQTGTPDAPEIRSEPFDVVLAMNLLHLLDELPTRLRQIGELVRGGGLFISKTPCLGERGLGLRLLIPLLRLAGLAPYVNFSTERSLTFDITNAGFAVEETGMYPRSSRSFFVVARKLQ